MAFERHHSAWIIASSMITVVSFVSATAYTQNRLSRLDALASTIERNAVPSIEYLSRAARRLTRLGQLMEELPSARQRSAVERSATEQAARREVQALEQDVAEYVRLAPLPGERAHWAALRSDVSRAAELVRASLDGVAVARSGDAADQSARDAALDAAAASVVATLDYDVGQAKAIARSVRQERQSALQTIVALDAAATLVALFGLLVAYRASRRHDKLLRAHNSLLATRVTELDRFAGRVSHDLLNPLGTISAGLAVLAMGRGEQGQAIERSQRALRRAGDLVQGLLEFARAGAPAESSASCALDAVLPGIVGDCSHIAAETGVALVIDAEPSVCVPCSPGVMTSIVQNLVQNAIKYMGARPIKRVTVRTRCVGTTVRLDVEDTGPGIPTDVQATMFDPFVRGPNPEVNGSGLGLATVKRLVESHGGTISVQSKVGAGTLFRIELPLPRVQERAAGESESDIAAGRMVNLAERVSRAGAGKGTASPGARERPR